MEVESKQQSREIILDTETTGFNPWDGDRLVEIGCIETIDGIFTGRTFHQYLDPEMEMPEGAFKVHGLSTEFLTGKPKFKDVVNDFLNFLEDSPLVIHNSKFDMKFINAELKWAGKPAPTNKIICTLEMARKGSGFGTGYGAHSLDSLCKKYGVDNSNRTLHGALLDAELLLEVYGNLKADAKKEAA